MDAVTSLRKWKTVVGKGGGGGGGGLEKAPDWRHVRRLHGCSVHFMPLPLTACLHYNPYSTPGVNSTERQVSPAVHMGC